MNDKVLAEVSAAVIIKVMKRMTGAELSYVDIPVDLLESVGVEIEVYQSTAYDNGWEDGYEDGKRDGYDDCLNEHSDDDDEWVG